MTELQESTLQEFDPADRLHAAIRRRYPQIAAAVIRNEETDPPYVSVTYRDAGPMIAEWTGTTYRWRTVGGGPWEMLYDTPERTADAIAPGLGVRTPPDDADDEQP